MLYDIPECNATVPHDTSCCPKFAISLHRYGVADAWWCTYDDIGRESQALADRMRYEYLLTGDALDVFITSKLDTEQLKKITEELYKTIEMGADGDAESKLQKILDGASAQGLYKRGVIQLLYFDYASCDVNIVIFCFGLSYCYPR